MKPLVIATLFVAGCTPGFIGELPPAANVDRLVVHSLELTGATSDARTVMVGDRADDDGTDDQAFRFTWTLDGCHDPDCLPADAGETHTHVFRIRATNSAGEHLYKKVTVTLDP